MYFPMNVVTKRRRAGVANTASGRSVPDLMCSDLEAHGSLPVISLLVCPTPICVHR